MSNRLLAPPGGIFMIAIQPDILETLRRAEAYLAERGVPNARRNAEWMLAHVLGCPSTELYLDPHRLLERSQSNQLSELVRRRGEREPLQYILGSTEFMSILFETVPGVFIPRPDTEVLVERVETLMGRSDSSDGAQTLDLCCGAGVIVISLACRNGGVSGVGVDIDPRAVALTRTNAERNGVAGRIECVTVDAIEYLDTASRTFHVITCNPPYVPTGDMERLPPEIGVHEPPLSLDGGADGLDFYRRVVPHLIRALGPGGIAAFEIGDDQGAAVAGLLGAASFVEIDVHKDYTGLDRVVTARKP